MGPHCTYKCYVLLYPRTEKNDLEIYETRYNEGYDIYDPKYYEWLKSTHPSYVEEWYHKVVTMVGSSSQEASPGLSVPSAESEHSAMLDSSGSSIELELAEEGNKDLEKYTRRYEEGYNIFDAQYYAWLQCTHPSYAKRWYQTAVKTGSTPVEPETDLESSDMPGPSGLSSNSTGQSMGIHGQDKNIQSDDSENICIYVHN